MTLKKHDIALSTKAVVTKFGQHDHLETPTNFRLI